MVSDPIITRLRRLCWFVGRLADLDRPVTLSPEVLRGLHEALLGLLSAVGERFGPSGTRTEDDQ
jgi:hypothetical protein